MFGGAVQWGRSVSVMFWATERRAVQGNLGDDEAPNAVDNRAYIKCTDYRFGYLDSVLSCPSGVKVRPPAIHSRCKNTLMGKNEFKIGILIHAFHGPASNYLYTNYHHRPTPLRVRRHNRIRLRANRILTPPQARHSLRLRVEIDPRLSVERARTPTRNTLLVSGEAEHGQGDGNGYIDTDLAGLDLVHEFAGGGAGAREDGGAVAVFVGVD